MLFTEECLAFHWNSSSRQYPKTDRGVQPAFQNSLGPGSHCFVAFWSSGAELVLRTQLNKASILCMEGSPEFQTPAGSQCHAPQMGHWLYDLYDANKIILRDDWPTKSFGHSNGMVPEPYEGLGQLGFGVRSPKQVNSEVKAPLHYVGWNI